MRALPLLLLLGCAGDVTDSSSPDPDLADAVAVAVSGEPGSYTFAVTLRSPDTGCERYADWWEVVSADGSALVYRRILGHSHVDEQPFTRSGGPVDLQPDTEVVVRAHLAPGGFGGKALRGTVGGGFSEVTLEEGFGAALETEPPLPEDCAF